MASELVAQEDLNRHTEIETTLEELASYQIVKAITCGETKRQRIPHREAIREAVARYR